MDREPGASPKGRDSATVDGSGAAAQDGGVAAGEGGVAVGGNVYGDVVVGVPGQPSPPEELRQARQQYLEFVVDTYRYLDFKGMGIADRVPLRLELHDLYVPLKACLQLPRGETWERAAARKLPVGRQEEPPDRLGEPRPVLDLAEESDGLIILGDPGAGKTTFLKRLALDLALDSGEHPRLPLLVPISAYANALARDDALRLDGFIGEHFHTAGADEALKEVLSRALQQGRATLMLDGLDEVGDLALRKLVVSRVVDFFRFHRKAGNRFLLTSRLVGYPDVRPTAAGMAECTLDDFDDDQIEAFVAGWTTALEKAARGHTPVAAGAAARERAELLQSIGQNPGVRRLAVNPLLLTILALMRRQGVPLPDRRVELYDKYVEVLLTSWNRERGLGQLPTRDLDVGQTVKTLAQVALWMHCESGGVGLVEERRLLARLLALHGDRPPGEAQQAANRFLSDVREYAGLLLERGPKQYGFLHLTFEEYLAAVALAEEGQLGVDGVVTELARHVDEPEWREVALLTVGYIGIVQGRDRAAGALVEGLLNCGKGQPGRAVVLAGDAVADAWPGGVTGDCKRTVTAKLLETMADDANVDAATRVAAGNTLARLGDPRFRADAWFLPDEGLLGFVEIPKGTFLMGSDKRRDERAWDDELPQHPVDLPTFYMARYPVTVAQFRAFVETSGHKPADEDCLRGTDNHPVGNVTWHDASAYCQWLTDKLRKWKGTPEVIARLLGEGWTVVLPSEAEWEKGARGTEGRIHPWGDEPDPNRANYGDTAINATSAVGSFPGGASPYGVQDLAGNIWERTRSRFVDYPYLPTVKREALDAGDEVLRVLRGGSFFSSGYSVRCAYRGRFNPYFRSLNFGFRVVLSPSLNI
jgi:formylglycine-generating enzyme required for sulfatase activity